MSVGIDLSTRGVPNKQVYGDATVIDFEGNTSVEKQWGLVGDGQLSPWTEVFMAYTKSDLRATGQGRINYTLGGGLTYYPPSKAIMPRVYSAVNVDLRKNLKFLAEFFYDPYWPSSANLSDNSQLSIPFDIDFGFIYAVNENFRFGLHFQRPLIAFYYKF